MPVPFPLQFVYLKLQGSRNQQKSLLSRTLTGPRWEDITRTPLYLQEYLQRSPGPGTPVGVQLLLPWPNNLRQEVGTCFDYDVDQVQGAGPEFILETI